MLFSKRIHTIFGWSFSKVNKISISSKNACQYNRLLYFTLIKEYLKCWNIYFEKNY